MPNSQTRKRISPAQLSITLIEVCIGTEMITTANTLVSSGGQAAWLSVLLGGIIFYIIALCMLITRKHFPQDTFVEYMPKLWGKAGSRFIIWWAIILFGLIFCTNLITFSRIIVFYLFDRTPTEVILLCMLFVCIYGALHDWDTILQFLQLIFFTVTPIFGIVWLIGLLNFNAENLLPLWPENWTAVISTAFKTWPAYSGYEIILLLAPLTFKSNLPLTRSLAWSFAYMALFFTMLVVIAIGVLSAEGVKAAPYPILSVVRGVQIPGTFVERLEGYFLLLWIPIAFDSFLALLWSMAEISRRYSSQNDHRPWVLAIAPLLFVGSSFIKDMATREMINQVTLWTGLGFSFCIIPSTLFILWRKRGIHVGTKM